MTTAAAGAAVAAAAQGQAVPAALELEWFDLRKKALQKLEQGVCTVDAADKELRSWDDTVLRFRKLREALTAAHAPANIRCEVYELSALVCAAARNMAELLKCLQQLVNSIYPAQRAAAVEGAAAVAVAQTSIEQQQQQQQQQQRQQQRSSDILLHPASDVVTSSSSISTSSSSGWHTEDAAAAQVQRQAEVSAALLLYFVCIPRQPIMQELIKQLKAAAHCYLSPSGNSSSSSVVCHSADLPEPLLLLQHPTYQLAVQAAAAVLNCHWVQFMGCYLQQPSMLMRVLMECALQRMRLHTVHSAVAAYRMLPSTVLVRWLGLQTDHQQQQQQQQQDGQAPAVTSRPQVEDVVRKQLVGVLVQAGDRGCKGARLAAEQCMTSETAALPDTLQFRG